MAHVYKRPVTGAPEKKVANKEYVDAVVKAAKYDDMARRTGDRQLADAYRRMAQEQRDRADVLPATGDAPAGHAELVAKAAGLDEKAARSTDADLARGYRELALDARAQAAELLFKSAK